MKKIWIIPALAFSFTLPAQAQVAFAELDGNQDGFIDAAEAGEIAALADAFVTLDADADGKLSPEEFSNFPQ